MKKLDKISADLFNKIRGRFENITIGDENGQVTNVPEQARYFDFSYLSDGVDLGKVSVAVDPEKGLSVIVAKDIAQGQMEDVQDGWYNFLKELRVFAKKRMMHFEVRDINKSNLNKRDYQFLAQNRNGENTMAESKMYGNDRTSFQKVGKAKISVKHSAPINVENASSRTSKISKIFIESPDGEKFRFPYKHLAGARALARHVAEGGHAYDDFGKYITSLSEEMSKIRKLNTYMGRNTVMAETLDQYSDVLKQRVSEVRKEISNLQKPTYYAEAVENFVAHENIEVPEDVAENWIDQLTIKQFNEELKDVFPYVYKLIGEATKATELGPDDLDESGLQYHTGVKKHGKEYMDKAAAAGRDGASQEELGRLRDKYSKAAKESIDDMLETAIDQLMGQFAEAKGMSDEEKEKTMKRAFAKSDEPERGETRKKVSLKKAPWETDEGNAYSGAVAKAKMNGKKKGDKIDGPDGDEITLEKEKTPKNLAGEIRKKAAEVERSTDDTEHRIFAQQIESGLIDLYQMTNSSEVKDLIKQNKSAQRDTDSKNANNIRNTLWDVMTSMESEAGIPQEKEKTPIGEFILSYFDRENGTFPKGETAVLTMVEKDYGEQYVEPAAQFIQKVEAMVAERNAKEAHVSRYPETDRIKALAGL